MAVAPVKLTNVPPQFRSAFSALDEKVQRGLVSLYWMGWGQKRNDVGKFQQRVLVVVVEAVFSCTPDGEIARCITLNRITRLIVSDDSIGIVVPSEYDMYWKTVDAIRIATLINDVCTTYLAPIPVDRVPTAADVLSRVRLTRPKKWEPRLAPDYSAFAAARASSPSRPDAPAPGTAPIATFTTGASASAAVPAAAPPATATVAAPVPTSSFSTAPGFTPTLSPPAPLPPAPSPAGGEVEALLAQLDAVLKDSATLRGEKAAADAARDTALAEKAALAAQLGSAIAGRDALAAEKAALDVALVAARASASAAAAPALPSADVEHLRGHVVALTRELAAVREELRNAEKAGGSGNDVAAAEARGRAAAAADRAALEAEKAALSEKHDAVCRERDAAHAAAAAAAAGASGGEALAAATRARDEALAAKAAADSLAASASARCDALAAEKIALEQRVAATTHERDAAVAERAALSAQLTAACAARDASAQQHAMAVADKVVAEQALAAARAGAVSSADYDALKARCEAAERAAAAAAAATAAPAPLPPPPPPLAVSVSPEVAAVRAEVAAVVGRLVRDAFASSAPPSAMDAAFLLPGPCGVVIGASRAGDAVEVAKRTVDGVRAVCLTLPGVAAAASAAVGAAGLAARVSLMDVRVEPGEGGVETVGMEFEPFAPRSFQGVVLLFPSLWPGPRSHAVAAAAGARLVAAGGRLTIVDVVEATLHTVSPQVEAAHAALLPTRVGAKSAGAAIPAALLSAGCAPASIHVATCGASVAPVCAAGGEATDKLRAAVARATVAQVVSGEAAAAYLTALTTDPRDATLVVSVAVASGIVA